MKGGFQIMSKPQLKAVIQRMEKTEHAAAAAGDHRLAFTIQQKIVELAFVLYPELDKRPVRIVATNGKKKGGKVAEPEAEPEAPQERLEDMRELSDEDLEKSLGLR